MFRCTNHRFCASDRLSPTATQLTRSLSAQKVLDLQAANRNFQSFVTALTSEKGYLPPTPLGMAGSGGHVVHNPNLTSKPWEPSMLELRNTKVADEERDRIQQLRKIDIDFSALRRQKRQEQQKQEDRQQQRNEEHHHEENDDLNAQEVVMYYETSSAEGLSGFQTVAEMVMEGKLPGECSNLTGQRGYATWSVPKKDFLKIATSAMVRSDATQDRAVISFLQLTSGDDEHKHGKK